MNDAQDTQGFSLDINFHYSAKHRLGAADISAAEVYRPTHAQE